MFFTRSIEKTQLLKVLFEKFEIQRLGRFIAGGSENEEDTIGQVVRKVFQDLPGCPKLGDVMENDAARSGSYELAGYDACRRIALDFVRGTVKQSESWRLRDRSLPESRVNFHQRDDNEIRMRMLASLDLHLACKQRDYANELTRQ